MLLHCIKVKSTFFLRVCTSFIWSWRALFIKFACRPECIHLLEVAASLKYRDQCTCTSSKIIAAPMQRCNYYVNYVWVWLLWCCVEVGYDLLSVMTSAVKLKVFVHRINPLLSGVNI